MAKGYFLIWNEEVPEIAGLANGFQSPTQDAFVLEGSKLHLLEVRLRAGEVGPPEADCRR